MSIRFPSVDSNDVVKVLIKIGFKFKRQSGNSHAIYFREDDKKRTTVPIYTGKILKRRTMKSILADAAITIEEFEKLRK